LKTRSKSFRFLLELFAALFVISLVLSIKARQRHAEPRFEGITARAWTYGVTLANPETPPFKALLALGPSAVPYVLEEYEGEGTKLQRSEWYRATYKKVPSPLKNILPRPAMPRDESSKLALISFLSRFRPPQPGVEEFLLEQAQNDRPQIRFYACEALRSLHCSSRRTKQIVESLLEDPDPSVQSSALSLLVELKIADPAMVPKLQKIAGQSDGIWANENRAVALYALWSVGAPNSEQCLENFLAQENIRVIQPVIEKLKGDPHAAETFLQTLETRYEHATDSTEQEFLKEIIFQLKPKPVATVGKS
jgi:hypothetical protein